MAETGHRAGPSGAGYSLADEAAKQAQGAQIPMRFVIGVNDDYIDQYIPENLREAVAYGLTLESDPAIWKVDIEARDEEDDDTLLVMILFEKDEIE